MSLATTFGDIRSLTSAPSEASWSALGEALLRWQDQRELDDVIIPYCSQRLAAWPDKLRVAPRKAVRDMLFEPKDPAPILRLARVLSFEYVRIEERSWHTVCHAPCWQSLNTLHLTMARIPTVSGWKTLFESPLFSQLEALHISRQRLSDSTIASLEAHPHTRKLRALGLSRCALELRALERICGLAFERLEHLDLRDNRLREEGASLLARSPNLGTLRTLLLGANPSPQESGESYAFFNRVGVRGLEQLARGGFAQHLTALDISHNKLGNEGAAMLSTARSFPMLESLDVSFNAMTSAAGIALSKSRCWEQLERVDLSANPLGAGAIAALLQAPNNLEVIRLDRTKPGKSGMRGIATSQHLGALRELSLASNELSSDELRPFLASPALSSLATLDLHDNFLDSRTFLDLLDAPHLETLRELDLCSLMVRSGPIMQLLEDPRAASLPKLYLCGTSPHIKELLGEHPLASRFVFSEEWEATKRAHRARLFN